MSGYEALRIRAAWIDLSSRGNIRVRGEDRARLLHAMCTNSVTDLSANEGVYAFFLNEKGRILADALILNLSDGLLLDTEPEAVEKLRFHLEKYIIADDVELEDETSRWAEIGLEGPKALDIAAELAMPVPAKKYAVAEWNLGFVVRAASTGPEGIRIFVLDGDKPDLLQRLNGLAIPQASPYEARIVRIENGIPRNGEEITDRYLVQETQQLHAVHPNKGCYLGQEIVERVRSRGQVHRLLTPIRMGGSIVPPAGTKLMAGGDSVGEIASAVYSPALGEVVGLAYLRDEALGARSEMSVEGAGRTVLVYAAASPSNLP